MSKIDQHPCFQCTLPDCNDKDSKCRLRMAESAYRRAGPNGRNDTIRRDYNFAYSELYATDRNERRRKGATQ